MRRICRSGPIYHEHCEVVFCLPKDKRCSSTPLVWSTLQVSLSVFNNVWRFRFYFILVPITNNESVGVLRSAFNLSAVCRFEQQHSFKETPELSNWISVLYKHSLCILKKLQNIVIEIDMIHGFTECRIQHIQLQDFINKLNGFIRPSLWSSISFIEIFYTFRTIRFFYALSVEACGALTMEEPQQMCDKVSKCK